MKYASIVPLIGGETIGAQSVFGGRPEYLLSYSPFTNNDQHIVKHYRDEVPYRLLDKGETIDLQRGKIDSVNAVCPCAGLSSLSPSAKADSTTNDWMIQSSEYVLENIRPRVLWGENAPRLASKMGEPTVARMRVLAKKHGYTVAIYKTKSILHGLSQVRDRTFYFFFMDSVVPRLNFYRRKHITIDNHIRGVTHIDGDPMWVLTNEKVPSRDPFYRFVLEKQMGGMTHKQFQEHISRSINPMDFLENHGCSYRDVATWFREQGFSKKLIDRCKKIDKKLSAGGNVMRKLSEVPKDYIGAFVGHLPTMLTHPDEDRYLTIRECLSIMGLPNDFVLQGGRKNLNHVCQNVPVQTAADMATEVAAYIGGQRELMNASFAIIDNKSQTIDADYPSVSLDGFFS